jgi:thymidylate synthase
MNQIDEMLTRPIIEEKAKLKLNKNIETFDGFSMDDIVLENYVYHPSIKADVAV